MTDSFVSLPRHFYYSSVEEVVESGVVSETELWESFIWGKFMSKFAWIAIMSLFVSFSSFAAEQKVSKATLKKLVTEYYLSQASTFTDECQPKKSTCIAAACAKMPSYYCDEKSELKDISLACSNVDGRCLENVCKRMLSYYCDEPAEVKAVALACKGLLDSECIDVVCSKMPAYYCDEFAELKEIVDMCKNP
jgi:hypothetical protein